MRCFIYASGYVICTMIFWMNKLTDQPDASVWLIDYPTDLTLTAMNTMMILKGLGFAALGIGLFMLATYVVMRLWNWLVPALFNGPRLRFVQALGLFLLARLLFGFGGLQHGGHVHGGSRGSGPHGHSHHGYGRHWHQSDWQKQFVDPKADKRSSLTSPQR